MKIYVDGKIPRSRLQVILTMTPTTIQADVDELPVSKLCRETLVAIEGLQMWDESDGDEYLDFFGYLLEDLRTTTESRQGGFPLIEQLDLDDNSEIVRKLRELDSFATEMKQIDPSERHQKYDREEIKRRVNDAEEIYSFFNDIESSHGMT